MRPLPTASLGSIPDELLMDILYLVPTEDLARGVQAVSRRFHRLSSEPRLWLQRCRSDFAHWTAEHRALLAGARRGGRGPWHHMWVERRRADALSARHFDRVLASKTRRLFHLECICRRGLDAKDFLLAQYHMVDGEDVLARRYFAQKALSSIHRSLALEVWFNVQAHLDGYDHLEQALGAFDMFVLNDGEEDLDEIDHTLDRLAAQFQADYPDFATMTTRQKSLELVHWVRSRGLVGLDNPERTFRNVRNCLIGQALADPEHPSLPIISSTIYAGIARRLGLRAHCCAVPGHVYNTVLAPPGETVDGRPFPLVTRRSAPSRLAVQDDPPTLQLSSLSMLPHAHTHSLTDNGERMFMDPFSHEGEVRLDTLRARVMPLVWGGLAESPDRFLMPAPTSAIVLRVALNLETSHAQAQAMNPNDGHGLEAVEGFSDELADLRQLRHGDADTNMEALRYATAWAAVLMRPPGSADWQHWLDRLLARLTQPFSEDMWLAERFLVPLYEKHEAEQAGLGWGGGRWDPDFRRPQRSSTAEWKDPRVLAKLVHNLDRRLPVVSRRYTQEICERVKYRVGQVFRHRRFGFVGIINGWTLSSPQEMRWTMGVQMQMPRQADQPADQPAEDDDGSSSPTAKPRGRMAFYSCLRPGVERQIVDDNNVELITDAAEVPEELFFLAGQNFKRFDAETCTFVSNIGEFFPDD